MKWFDKQIIKIHEAFPIILIIDWLYTVVAGEWRHVNCLLGETDNNMMANIRFTG